MRKLVLMCGIFLATNAYAEEMFKVESDNADPTIVYGEAENANGTYNEVTVKQPEDSDNPFGNPIVNTIPYGKQPAAVEQPDVNSKPSAVQMPQGVVSQESQQNPQIGSQNSPEEINSEIQNTLYEANDRVYDLQSYPNKDVNEIENSNSNVTNYPEY